SLSRRKSCCLKCSKPKPGPPVVSISTVRETPSAFGLSHLAAEACAAGGFAAAGAAARAGAAVAPVLIGAGATGVADGTRGGAGATSGGALPEARCADAGP